MVILMPPENCSNDRGYKMPFVACEIFERELSSILDPFFTAEDLSCAEEPITETKFDTLEDSEDEVLMDKELQDDGEVQMLEPEIEAQAS